jgi:D-arabinose 1-dehydrogenase-like Zn-dependent alcohol dehydrogenase
MRFENKVAVITGAAVGIGKGAAVKFALEGAKVVAIDIDKEKLEKYILELLGEEYISPRVRKQMNTFIEEYKFTYSGIHKALIYFYEIKGNPAAKANGGIGIVPYVYKDAFNYHYKLWLAQQKNENKIVQEYVPNIKEIIIPRPERKVKKRKLFTFLDEIEVEG